MTDKTHLPLRGRAATPRTTSETISHPLLGASPSTSTTTTSTISPSPTTEIPELPYKPRQQPSRPPAPPAMEAPALPVTSTPTVSAATSNEEGATARLQLQSLKAAAQRLGLGNGSQGMAMIDAVFDKGARGAGGDWAELLRVLGCGKAIMLLPESVASSLPMTPQTLRDHVAFFGPGEAVVLVTLSGLIGTLRGTEVSFESTVPQDSPLIAALKDDTKRTHALGSLRATQRSELFPSYTLSAESAPLHFPPLGKPQPDKKKEEVRRYPFMSLFGATPTRSMSPERPSSPSPVGSSLSSPKPSITSLERVDSNTDEGYAVTAYTISKPVRYTEVHKALVKAVRSTVRAELEGLPDRIGDKVLRLVLSSIVPVSGSAVDQALLKSHHGPGNDEGVPLDFSDPAACGERLQDFMEAVYDDLIRHRDGTPAGEKEDVLAREKLAEEGAERVEALICRLLYNRIFSPLQSDDAQHDEALASRIAALNLLDLSLDHLGLITRPADEAEKGSLASGLATLVEDIGHEFQKLSSSSCLTPKDKAVVLVHAHKIAVDGLGRLPPIQLRPEGEAYVPEKELEPIVEQSESSFERPPVEEESPNGQEEVNGGSTGSQSPRSESPVNLFDSVGTVRPKREQVEDNRDDVEENDAPAASQPTSPTTQTPSQISQAPPPPPATTSQPTAPTSGADLILPLIIYAVVKANPAQLASQLMYLQRYRSAINLAGEESYAIVNLTAVVEFIEHVQLSELGLGDGVISVEDLTPISLTHYSGAETDSIASASTRLKGRVFQVGELAGSAAGSANKVITGVVDSLSSLRGYITPVPDQRPRGASSFSLASVTASVANMAAAATAARTRSRASSQGEWADRELVEVASRPSSIKPATYSDAESSDEAEVEAEHEPEHHDIPETASIRSATSMVRDTSHVSAPTPPPPAAQGIGGRLAQMGFKSAPPPPEKEKASWFGRGPVRRPSALGLGLARSPSGDVASAAGEPIERFLTCEAGDLKLSEVGVLLRDYRRLAGLLAKQQQQQQH